MSIVASIVMNFFGSLGNIFGASSEDSPPPVQEIAYVEEEIIENPCCESYEGFYMNYACCIDPYRPYLRHTEGKGLGCYTGYTTLGFFLSGGELIDDPQNKIEPFFDIKGHVFNKGHFDGSVGLGVRRMNYCEHIWGLNAYYDARQGELNKWYQQAGGGIEFFTKHWGVHGNFYWPIGKRLKRSSPKLFSNYEEGYFVTCRKREEALRGGDIELGYSSTVYCRDLAFYAGIGPYFFKRFCSKDVLGGMGRVIISGWNYLALEGRLYYDKVNRVKGQGEITLTFPFGGCVRNQLVRQCKECCFDDVCLFKEIAASPVLRNEIIYLDQRCLYENFDPNGKRTRVAVVGKCH